MKTHRIILTVVLTLCVVEPCRATTEKIADFANLKVLDFPMPFCKASLALDLGPNYFVEIENQLPGTARYNQLIKLYTRKNWGELETALLAFRTEFESSPLIEAIDFLELESQIEQLSNEDEANLKKIENRFRDLLVLYPRSTMAPVLSGTLAHFYLKQGHYPKALSLYKSSRELFPFHSSNCAFLLGEAEANYGIGNTEEAAQGFKSVSQKCLSGRLQLGAQLRLIDIERDQTDSSKAVIQKYEKLITQNPTLVPRLYPEALLNLGELKYRSKTYPSAQFYFQDFSRNSTETHSCRPLYLKRMADLSLQQKKSAGEIVGNYLSVFEKYPKSEAGKFSRAFAYLIELPQVSDPESERRLEAINTEINSLQNSDFKALLEINRGLALLERGEDAGLQALANLRPRFQDLFKSDLDAYIRKKLLTIYEKRGKNLSSMNEKARDKILLDSLEESFASWFKGTPDERKVQLLYRGFIQQRFSDALDSQSPRKALQKLERWKSSSLFQEKLIDNPLKTFLSAQLAGWWVKQNEKNPKGIASELSDKSKELEVFFYPIGEALWVQANLDLQRPNTRNLSSVPSLKQLPAPLAILMGRAYRASKKFSSSKAVLQKATGKEWFPYQTIELMKTFQASGESQKSISLGQRVFGQMPKGFQPEILNLMREAVILGKQWKSSGPVLKLASSAQLSEKELAPYYILDAKASFERGDYLHSKSQYEKGISSNPESPTLPETKFQLGHCLYKLKDKEGAKKQWEEVAATQDTFWSPLAKNEIKMLETP